MNELTTLEGAVIRKLLDGDDETLAILRTQAEALKVLDREFTGVGFYTKISAPPELERTNKRSLVFGDVEAEIPELENGAGFLLYVENGLLHMLEGYTYGSERWPEQVTSFKLRYHRDPRNLSELHA